MNSIRWKRSKDKEFTNVKNRALFLFFVRPYCHKQQFLQLVVCTLTRMRELVIKDIYLVVTIIKCLIIGVATSPGYTVTLKKAY